MSSGYAIGPIRGRYIGQDDNERESFVRFLSIFGGVATISRSLIGPLMGISSMLWLMMRNDSAIDPRMAWM